MSLPNVAQDYPLHANLVFPVLYFKKKLNVDELRRVLKQRVCKFDRFSSRLVRTPGGTHLDSIRFERVPLDSIDMGYHCVVVEDVSSEKDVQALMNKTIAEGLDKSRPLWRYFYVPQLQ